MGLNDERSAGPGRDPDDAALPLPRLAPPSAAAQPPPPATVPPATVPPATVAQHPATASQPSATVPQPPATRRRPLFTRPVYLVTILAGGAVGTLLRYALEEAYPAGPGQWPWTTFGINVVGSFLLGALLTGLARSGPDLGWRRMVRLGAGTGFCGGFTTYSTFIVEVDGLARDGWVATGVAYALVSVVVGIAAALVGTLMMRRMPLRPVTARPVP